MIKKGTKKNTSALHRFRPTSAFLASLFPGAFERQNDGQIPHLVHWMTQTLKLFVASKLAFFFEACFLRSSPNKEEFKRFKKEHLIDIESK